MRKLAISAAALVVTVLPTACDYAYASQDNSVSTPAVGRSGHGSHSFEGGHHHGGKPGQVSDDNNSERSDDNGGNDDQDGGNDQDDNGRDGDNRNNGRGGDNNDDNGQDGRDNDDEQSSAENEGLDVLGGDCTESKLRPHDGFQLAPRCVSTAFGEVASENKSPSLLITDSPRSVGVEEKFTISVSTRNLVRDRFLGAAAGGYYLESSFLNEDGLQRGHFHTACRMLETTDTAPDAAPAPDFFLATQDNGGGAEPDTVKISVTGMPTAGTAQCAVWAGDGSHRIPMMQRADQTPAFDAVRITVE